MKICITSQGKTLDSKVEPRFGRSPYFIIYDTNMDDFEAIENPNIVEASGVGIKSGQLVADKKVNVVLTGQIGPKALDALQAANIDIVTNVTGTVKEAIDKYQSGSDETAEKFTTKQEPQGNINYSASEKQGWFGRCIRRWFRGSRRQGGGRRGFAGPGGYCICPTCGEKVTHQRGVPCRSMRCPKCNINMIRE